MLENSELKKNLDYIHKDQMEKEEKVQEERAEYQLQLQEAEKKHQALLLDTNKQVKRGVWFLEEPESGELTMVMRHFLQEGQCSALLRDTVF